MIFSDSAKLEGISTFSYFDYSKNERGFQRQPTIFQNEKRAPGAKKYNLKRYLRTVGLGIKTPLEVM